MARNKPKLLQIFVNPANVRDSPCVASSRGAERIQRQMKLRQEKFIVYEATVMLLLNIKKKYIYIYIHKKDVFKNFLDGVFFLFTHFLFCLSKGSVQLCK